MPPQDSCHLPSFSLVPAPSVDRHLPLQNTVVPQLRSHCSLSTSCHLPPPYSKFCLWSSTSLQSDAELAALRILLTLASKGLLAHSLHGRRIFPPPLPLAARVAFLSYISVTVISPSPSWKDCKLWICVYVLLVAQGVPPTVPGESGLSVSISSALIGFASCPSHIYVFLPLSIENERKTAHNPEANKRMYWPMKLED